MPKPIFTNNNDTKTETDSRLSLTRKRDKKQSQAEKHKTDQKLRQKRSPAYIKAMIQLDAGGKTHNHAQVDEILNAIKKEFEDIYWDESYIGYFCKCYLGNPYEVHIFDMCGREVQYDPTDPDSSEVIVVDSAPGSGPDNLVSLTGNETILGKGVIKHFKRGESLPGDLESARTLVVFGGYEIVEVYSDCFRAISGDGSVSVLPR